MGLSLSSSKYKTAKVTAVMSSFSQEDTKQNLGQADEFTICRLLVPYRIIEHYMMRATLLLKDTAATSESDDQHNIDETNLSLQVNTIPTELTMKPFAEEYEAAVLFADISGFSRLAEELTKELADAANAAEDLSNYVGKSLNKMVEVITDAGGDVIKFAGDAILAVFPTRPGKNLASCTLTAGRVALDLLKLHLSAGSVQLQVHCGIGAGTLMGYHVGGLNGRWEYFISGPVIEQFGSAEKEAEAKEVVISSEALVLMVMGVVACMPKSAVPSELRTLLAQTSHEGTFSIGDIPILRLNSLLNSGDIPIKVLRLPSESGNYKLLELGAAGRVKRESLAALEKKKMLVEALNPESPACAILLRALKCYIPGPVLLSISAKQSLWSAQFWLCSTLFIRLSGLTFESLEYVDHLQDVLLSVQQQLYDYQGTLCRMIVDDKGTGILAAFGLPPFAQHENDAVRGVKVAMNVVKIMADQFQHECSVGVTSGRVYAGVVGGRTRCEYTLHGSVVNLAARLMVAAGKSGDGVLVNDVVFRGANNEIEFNDPRRIRCKGYDYPIPVYRPYAVREEPLESVDELNDIQLICASQDLAVVKSALTHAAQVDCGGLIMVEGEAGMGKSRLCRFIVHTGTDQGFNVVRAASYDSAPPYYMWRQILSSLFGLKRYRSSREKMLECLIEAIPEPRRKLAPLLRDVFIGLTEDSVETATLTGQIRSEELANLIIDILHQWFGKYVPEALSEKHKGIIRMTSNVEPKPKSSKRGNSRFRNSTKQAEEKMTISDEGVRAVDLTPKAMKLLGMQTDMQEGVAAADAAQPESPAEETKQQQQQQQQQQPSALKHQDSVRYTMSVMPDRLPHMGHMFLCEDVHWMDEASVSLLVRAVCEFPDVLFVFSSRPTDGLVVADHIDQLRSFEETVHLSLRPFTETQVAEAIKLIVDGAQSVDRTLVKLVYKRVQGHPLFTLELIRMLDNLGKLGIPPGDSKGKCSLVGLTDFTELALPDTVRGLMTGRFNRIEDNETRARMQQVLKVASVFGSEFPVDLLLDTLPREDLLTENSTNKPNTENLKADDSAIEQKSSLMADLEGLEKMGFIARLSAPTGSTEGTCYRFEQSMMRQSAYDMLLFEHRRNYHSRIANLLERRNAGCVDLVYAELAQHFFKAEDALKAIEYLEKAAQMHFAAYQMGAAKNCFSRLLRITGNIYGDLPEDIRSRAWKRGVDSVPGIVTRLNKAQWTRFMGEILVEQHEYDAAAAYFLSALEVLRLPSPPTTMTGRMRSNFSLNRSSAIATLRNSTDAVLLLEAARIYSCMGSNAEAQHTRAVAISVNTMPTYPFRKLENVYLFALKYALAANCPEEPGFVVACANMAATLVSARGSSNRAVTLFQIAEKQLPQVTDIKAQILVRTHLANYALLECNYTRAEQVLKKLIWTAHFHHLRTVQLHGLEMMWVLKRIKGKANDMLGVAAEIREFEPVLGLLFEAFGAAEVGGFEECARSLEGVRRLNGNMYSHSHRSSIGSSATPSSNANHGRSTQKGSSYHDRVVVLHHRDDVSRSPRNSSGVPLKHGSMSSVIRPKRISRVRRSDATQQSPHSPRRGGADLETLLLRGITDIMDTMPKTLSLSTALAHYCLSRGQPRHCLIAAMHGLRQYRDGVVGMRMFDYFTMSSCLVAACQAQVMQPSLLGFSEYGYAAEQVLSQSMKVLFRYAKMKPCCKVVKKYVRGWNAARRRKTWKATTMHWKAGLRYAETYGMPLDAARIRRSISAMESVKKVHKVGRTEGEDGSRLAEKGGEKENLKLLSELFDGQYVTGSLSSFSSTVQSQNTTITAVDEVFPIENRETFHYKNPSVRM